MPKATAYSFKHKSATATVQIYFDGTCGVYNVQSEKRKKGHGTGLMKKIVKWADKHDRTVLITADAFGPKSFKKNKDLADFYKRFGFLDAKNPPIHLKRKPH